MEEQGRPHRDTTDPERDAAASGPQQAPEPLPAAGAPAPDLSLHQIITGNSCSGGTQSAGDGSETEERNESNTDHPIPDDF